MNLNFVGVRCRKINGNGYVDVSYQPYYASSDIILSKTNSHSIVDTNTIPLECRRKILDESYSTDARNCEKIDNERCVELYHMSIAYQFFDNAHNSTTGEVLASCSTYVKDVCHNLCKLLAPELSTSCIRIWYPTRISPFPTQVTDGYEVMDVNLFCNVRLLEWKDVKVLVETRHSLNQPWPREEQE